MLVKQGWGLLTYDSYLLEQVLRHKYYRNCSFMVAKVGSNAFSMERNYWGSKIVKWWVDVEIDFEEFYSYLGPTFDTNGKTF